MGPGQCRRQGGRAWSWRFDRREDRERKVQPGGAAAPSPRLLPSPPRAFPPPLQPSPSLHAVGSAREEAALCWRPGPLGGDASRAAQSPGRGRN